MDLFKWVKGSLQELVNMLPLSPFHEHIQNFADSEWIAYFNWFVPVKELMIITGGWITCIAVFYLMSVLLRWIKAIS